MGSIHERFKAKSARKPALAVIAPLTTEVSELVTLQKVYGSSQEPTLDKSLANFKYVVSYDRTKEEFTVDTTRDWKFHSDCYIPNGNRLISAGWISCPFEEFKKDDYTNMTTWGRSIGFNVGTHPRDLKMLKQYFTGNMQFNKDGDPI